MKCLKKSFQIDNGIMNMFSVKDYKYNWMHLGIMLVFLFPLFTNTLRHWASSTYVLLVLVSLISLKNWTYDLKKEEKIFLAIMVLHVVSSVISNALAGWTRASHTWFFSGDIRFLFAVPVYLYLRSIPGIWKYFLMAVPIGAAIIGITGIVDFMMRYLRGDVEMIFAEGVYGHIFQGNISALWSVLSYAALGFYKSNKTMRMLCVSGAVLGAAGALVSVTRNAWLSLVLLYMLAFVLQGGVAKTFSSIGMKRAVLIAVALCTGLYFLSGIDYVNARFTRIFQEPVAYFNADRSKPIEFTSIGFRLEQWRSVIYAIEEKPVFGHGIGNIGIVQNRYIREGKVNQLIYQEPTEKYGTPVHVHSVYFEYLGDTGIVGFILILLVMFYAPYVAFRSRSKDNLAWKLVIIHGAAFAIASLTEVPFIRNNWTSVFLLPGLVMFIWLMNENDKDASELVKQYMT
jgi:O-antigen ligase